MRCGAHPCRSSVMHARSSGIGSRCSWIAIKTCCRVPMARVILGSKGPLASCDAGCGCATRFAFVLRGSGAATIVVLDYVGGVRDATVGCLSVGRGVIMWAPQLRTAWLWAARLGAHTFTTFTITGTSTHRSEK